MTHHSLIKAAIRISWFTIAYNLLEGLVSIFFGINDDSIALAGFGVDSLIEVSSALLVLWRFKAESLTKAQPLLQREKQATLGIGILFVLLATLTLVASVLQIHQKAHPSTTTPGLIISVLSLSFMFWLWKTKRSLATKLDSITMQKDAACSLACIKLSSVLFAGSLLYLSQPALWWADSAAAIVLAILIGKEGIETIRATRRPDFTGGCACND